MIANLSRRERLVIGIGIAAVLAIGGWMLIVQPLRDRSRLAGELVPVREQLLTRRQELISRKAEIASELQAMNARIETLNARFLPASTPAVAASELQKLVKELAAEASTEVRSERIMPPVERGELLEIPIEITVSGEVRQLVDLLSRLDAAPKLLAVENLRVRVVNISQPRDLLATLTLSGFILPERMRT
jgi:Tfp pilus assembly protein PilO